MVGILRGERVGLFLSWIELAREWSVLSDLVLLCESFLRWLEIFLRRFVAFVALDTNSIVS
jgi:hypothetical protein